MVHAAICKYRGYKTIRRSRLVEALCYILRVSGTIVAPREEEALSWGWADGQTAFLDVSYVARGCFSFVDLTNHHLAARKYQRQAADHDGAAARAAETSNL